jgi:tryptophan halogenase|tara:strand:- start:80 stop:1204 length:1125 start_codon:yes stop_codon:yes gene_type:complete
MKITIIGRGNAGCISAMHYAHYRHFLKQKVEIELIYDSKISPVPTGQGTTLDFPEKLFENFRTSYLSKFPTTIKTGIMYEGFGKKNYEIFHNFPIGQYGLHFEPKEFQKFVCDNLKINFKKKDENIKDYNKIDADYIIDCRGTPKDFTNYTMLTNPLNCALLADLPVKKDDVKWTRSIAHRNGWCFYIPLPNRTSVGYLYNQSITSEADAIKDFKKMFHVKKINFVFPFQQYVANEPIIDDRVMLNGNKLFFLEPLEATAMGAYINASRYYYDYIFNNQSKEKTVALVKDYVIKVQNFILWHYATGSKYDTVFWKYAKKLWQKNKKPDIEEIKLKIKNMSIQDKQKSVASNFKYAQWQLWNFNLWNDGVTKNES